MTQVKFCGITNEEDSNCAVSVGAAALGFIFYPPSPRYIEPEAAREIILKLPPHIVKVGVFVNESAAKIKRVMKYCDLDFIQLHGDESTQFCRKFSAPQIIKAVYLNHEDDVKKILGYDVAAILVDSRHKGLYGGTGIVADWELARLAGTKKPLILSGGLNENNVKQAIEAVMPCAMDINSGVEISPGKKDPEKMARLMKIVKGSSAAIYDKKKIFKKR